MMHDYDDNIFVSFFSEISNPIIWNDFLCWINVVNSESCKLIWLSI